MARDENMIAALKRERAGYAARGDEERVRQVDEQLARHGYAPEGDGSAGPEGRTETPKETADQGTAAAKKTAAKKTAVAPPAE